LAAATRLSDEVRIAFDNLVDTVTGGATPTLRLGVTGLSRAGKTVFITALVHNLIYGGRLPLFGAYAEGRLTDAELQPQPDDEVPRFAYEDHVRDLVEKRIWPQSTRRISELRLTIHYESARMLKRRLGSGTLHLDIVDYPGEWLLDLSLLSKNYAEWSRQAFEMAAEPHRAPLSADWRAASAAIDPGAPADEATARKLATLFTTYLRNARGDRHALSMLPPGRFLMPGDLEGSPALTFAPLELPDDGSAGRDSLAEMMERRYEAYRNHVVRPFFRNHFARLDRQIVLVDMLAALNAGPAALSDLETALADVLACFRTGERGWLPSVVSRRIDRILFAATKADHVHRGDHDNLAALLRRLIDNAARRAAYSGARVRVMPIAAVRATREVEVIRKGQQLPAIAGIPEKGQHIAGETYDGDTEIALFPGDLPDDPDSIFQRRDEPDSDQLALRYLRFRPPALERTAEGLTLSLPHIRLDQALDYLIGDRLR
jgi:predicted YcjX-like family ATPase